MKKSILSLTSVKVLDKKAQSLMPGGNPPTCTGEVKIVPLHINGFALANDNR